MAWKFWQKAAKPVEVTGFDREPLDVHVPEPVMPAREQGKDPAPTTYCVITRVKRHGVAWEHHSVCGGGNWPTDTTPAGLVTVTTGHWV